MKTWRFFSLLKHAAVNGNGIAKRLILALVLYSTLITAVITVIQLYRDYHAGLEQLEDNFSFIEQSFLPVLADSVWVDDDRQIQAQLAGMLKLRDMEYLAVLIDGRRNWEVGEQISKHVRTSVLPLYYAYRGENLLIGELHAVASVDNLQSRVLTELVYLLIENGIKTLLIVLFVLLVFQVMVTRHLATLSRYARETDPRQPDREDLKLDRRPSGLWRPDALDSLTQSMNTMRHTIQSAYAEMRVSHRRVQQGEERLRLAMSVANGGVWDWSMADGKVFYSPGWLTMLGYDPRHEVNTFSFFVDSLHPDDKPQVMDGLQELIDHHVDNFSAEFRLRQRSGAWLWVLGLARATRRDAEDKALRVVGTMVSINDRKQAELGLIELNQQLEERIQERTADLEQAIHLAQESDQAQTQFLSRLSHGLRTPLNSILGAAQLLLSGSQDRPSAEQKMRLEDILRSGDDLLQLINELLDLSRIESGRLDLRLEALEPELIVHECMEMMKPLAAHRQISMTMEVGTTSGVIADEQRLRQVLIKLLSNAVKYNREGGYIHVSCGKTAAGHLRIAVQDAGLGIAEEDLPRLFKPFERLERNTHGIEGTGIGLALSKRLVEAMNGSIGVSSVTGKGSLFWIELPIST